MEDKIKSEDEQSHNKKHLSNKIGLYKNQMEKKLENVNLYKNIIFSIYNITKFEIYLII